MQETNALHLSIYTYFFTDPLFSFLVADPTDFLDLTAFVVVALVITRIPIPRLTAADIFVRNKLLYDNFVG